MIRRHFLTAMQGLMLMTLMASVLPKSGGVQVQEQLASNMAATEHLTGHIMPNVPQQNWEQWVQFLQDPKNLTNTPVINYTARGLNANNKKAPNANNNAQAANASNKKAPNANNNSLKTKYGPKLPNRETKKNNDVHKESKRMFEKMSNRARGMWLTLIARLAAAMDGAVILRNLPLETPVKKNNNNAKKNNNKNNKNNGPQNRHVREILTLAEQSLAKTGFRLPNMAQFNKSTTMEFVDDVLVDMVRAFNGVSTKHQVSLYNGINGELLTGPEPIANSLYKEHVYIRLGHMLVPLQDATLSKQLGITMASVPGALLNKARKNVRVEGDISAINEVGRFDATLKKKVRQTNSPITVIAYSIGQRLQYSMKDPKKQMRQQKQYLYQGIIPEKFRKQGQSFCYVLSKFPPTILQDKVSMQRTSGVPVNPNEPIQKRVLRTTFRKHHWRTPQFVKKASAEDVGVVAAGVGLGTLSLSSMAMLL